MALSATAVTVTVTPGTLHDAIADPASETSLTVEGSINAADFDFIREMTSLTSLDLSKASVTEYAGPATAAGITSSPAGVLPDCALMSGTFSTLSLPAGITEIGDGALGNSRAENVTIPSTVTKIGTGAFSGMTALKSVVIPAGVTSLPEKLFKDCQALESAEINANVTLLPAYAFQNCPRLSQVTLPESLTEIGKSAFAGCTALKSVTLPAGLQKIDDMAFISSGLTSLDLSRCENLATIGDWAFAGCTGLTDITMESNPVVFGKGAFFNNASLNISLGKLAASITDIPGYLLYGASSATADGFADTSVETLGDYSLSGMKDATVTLPSTLTHLGDHAMERWDNLTSIDAISLADVPSLGESVWEGVDQPNTILYVPSSLYEAYKDAPQWQEFNISKYSTTDISPNDPEPASNLRAAFDGMILLLESDIDINAVQIYDISGRCLTITRNAPSTRLAIDTAPFDAQVFIIRLLLGDSTTPVLKLRR